MVHEPAHVAVARWQVLLRVQMLDTLVHEVGHHRWRCDETVRERQPDSEAYAVEYAARFVPTVVAPYLEQSYRAEVDRLLSWLERQVGVKCERRVGDALECVVFRGDHGYRGSLAILAQNQFVANLVGAYLPSYSIGYDACGYGCSDHASWTNQGYIASFPFEASARAPIRELAKVREKPLLIRRNKRRVTLG